MVSTIRMSDLSGQKRWHADLTSDLAPAHTVSQATEQYLQRVRTPDNGLRWNAFSRGVRLDGKKVLADLPEEDHEWTVMPEVSAG